LPEEDEVLEAPCPKLAREVDPELYNAPVACRGEGACPPSPSLHEPPNDGVLQEE